MKARRLFVALNPRRYPVRKVLAGPTVEKEPIVKKPKPNNAAAPRRPPVAATPRLSPVAAAIGAAAEEAAGWPTMLAGTVTQAEASLLADWLIYLRAGVLLREQDAHYALRIYRHVRAEELRASATEITN